MKQREHSDSVLIVFDVNECIQPALWNNECTSAYELDDVLEFCNLVSSFILSSNYAL